MALQYVEDVCSDGDDAEVADDYSLRLVSHVPTFEEELSAHWSLLDSLDESCSGCVHWRLCHYEVDNGMEF